MNVLDIGIILVLLMFAIVGFKQGVIRELFAFIGIILIFYVSFLLSGMAGDILCLTLPFVDFIGALEGMSAINLLLYQGLAFILIFAVLLTVYEIILKVSKSLQKIINMTIILWLPSKLLGAVVGLLKGYILVFAILLVLIIPFGSDKLYDESKLANGIVYNTPVLSNSIGSVTKSTKEVYGLVDDVINQKITVREANLQTIDILLEHNIIDKQTVKVLVQKGKLVNVNGYEEILNNY